MPDDAANYRARAAAEMADGGSSALPNVRERAARSAAKWSEMAEMADKVSVGRKGREADAAERRSNI